MTALILQQSKQLIGYDMSNVIDFSEFNKKRIRRDNDILGAMSALYESKRIIRPFINNFPILKPVLRLLDVVDSELMKMLSKNKL